MRHRLTLLSACACTLALLAGAGSLRAESGPPEPEPPPPPAEEAAPPTISPQLVTRLIKRHRRATWYWQRVMGVRLTRELKDPPADPEARIAAWQRIAEQTWRRAQRPPHRDAWLCIHRYEGRWNDPNPPYYGGLQMDLAFQRTYGVVLLRMKGTADHWTPLEQMWVAEHAHRSGRGFYPWPNTARYCGLI
jgi:hypothetical protein